MGIYTDYFIATDEAIPRVELREGVINPALDTPLCEQQDGNFVVRRTDGSLWAVEGRPVMADATAVLEEILLGCSTAEPRLVWDFRGAVDVEAQDGGDFDPDDVDPEDDVWIFRYSDELLHALARVKDDECAAVAARWIERVYATGRSNAAEDCHEWLLPRLIELCRNAKPGEGLFAWQSL